MQVQLTRRAAAKITDVAVLQYPSGNGTDAQINGYALPILIQETIDAQSANIDMVSGATVTSDGLPAVAAERARPGGAVTAIATRRPARTPPRRAGDGHAGQPGAARPARATSPAADAPGHAVLADLREVDGVFST